MLNRFSLATALLATALYAVIAVLLADAPGASADGAAVLAWATARRTAILACTPVWTLSVAAIFAWSVSVAADLHARAEGEAGRALAILGGVGGVLTFTLSLVGFLCLTTLAWLCPGLDAGSARVLSALSLLSVNLTGIPTALTVLPWTWLLARAAGETGGPRAAPRPLIAWGLVVAALHLTSACAFGRGEGAMAALSPSGIGTYVAPPAY